MSEYLYRNGRFETYEHSWPETPPGEEWEWKKALESAGYWNEPTVTLGHNASGMAFAVDVYARQHGDREYEEPRFLVDVQIAEETHHVFTNDLPDLVPLLAQLAPIAVAQEATEAKLERWDHYITHRRKNRFDGLCFLCMAENPGRRFNQ